MSIATACHMRGLRPNKPGLYVCAYKALSVNSIKLSFKAY